MIKTRSRSEGGSRDEWFDLGVNEINKIQEI